MNSGISSVLRLSFVLLILFGVMFFAPAGAAMTKAQNDYLEKRRTIKASDPDALFKLAEWVWEKYPNNLDMLENASLDLKDVLKLKSNHTRAELLQRQVIAKIKILKKKTGSKVTGGVKRPTISEKYLLSDRDILWVRLKEYWPTLDKKVSIRFKNRVLRRYVDSMRGSEDDGWDKINKEKRFYKMPFWKRMDEILRNYPDEPGDEKLLKDIHITRDPKFMVTFRSKVWPVVQQNCASINCHGGSQGVGGLKLFPKINKSVKVDFTNFIILSGFRKGRRSMIDRQKIERSLLLQYGLNSKVSEDLHPQVGGRDIRPAFLSTKSASYRNITNWIASLVGPMAPNYHLKYKPPFGMKLHTSGEPILPSGAEIKIDEE